MEVHSDKSDEVDLHWVYHKTRRIFSGLWNLLYAGFLIVKKRWGLILIFSLLGMGAGIGLFFIARPVYTASLTMTSGALGNDFCSDLIEELQLLVEDNTPELLARRLKIDIHCARTIKKVEFNNYSERINKRYKDEDTVVLGLPFNIKVHAFNNTCFDTLQKALVNYLENNKYALKRKEIKKQNIKLLREKFQNEIIRLDSMKLVVASQRWESPRGNAGGFVFGQPLDPINMYKEGINIFQSDLELNKDLILIDNIQVINEFFVRNKPDSPKLWKTTTAGGSVGLLLGLLITFILERRKNNRNDGRMK